MHRLRTRRALAGVSAVTLAGGLAGMASLSPASASTRAAHQLAHSAAASGRTLSPSAQFFIPPPPAGAIGQEAQLVRQGDLKDAGAIAKMLATPQAVWFNGTTTSGATQTPQQAMISAATTMAEASLEGRVPVIVVYNIPGRDCDQYSAGGALSTADYEAWVSGIAQGLGSHQVVVILEPDALGNMPSDCLANNSSLNATNYPFSDSERLAEINDALGALEGDPNASVYLDGTHSAWQSVGTIAQRLVEAGVKNAQGFFLNVSNYQYTSNNIAYGTWISECIAYATEVPGGSFGGCPNQYWNGGPATGWSGTAMNNEVPWNDEPVSVANPLSNTVIGIDGAYANDLGSVVPTTHFVIDTSRNGTGPNEMSAYANAPYDQSAATVATLATGNWCNPPGAGLGLAPTANTGVPLVDAYLWVKTVGESDGECDAAGGVRAWDYSAYSQPGWPTTAAAQSLFDPLWGQDDPAAGAWFPAQAIQLTEDANSSPSAPGNAAPASS